jgi:4-coumarate--CoA ligase
VHPTFLPTVISTLELLKISKDEAKKRVILMTYVEDPSQFKKEGWMVLGDLLDAKKKPEKEEVFVGKDTDETALLCYSSGTTGLSKGVEVCASLLLAPKLCLISL